MVTLAEVKIGSMLKEIPKASFDRGNQYTKKEANSPVSEIAKPKSEVIEELGFNRQQVSQFQQMAEHEDVVMEAIAEARISKPTAVSNLKNRSQKKTEAQEKKKAKTATRTK